MIRGFRGAAVAACLCVIGVALSIGCTPAMTFPAYPGAKQPDPGLPPMPEIMADALAFAHKRLAPNTELVFNLPPGVYPNTWTRIAAICGGRPMQPGDTNVFSISQVRYTGPRAEVDIVYPAKNLWQVATVTLKGSAGEAFYAQYLQTWMVPTDAPICNTPDLHRLDAPSPEAPVETPAAPLTETPAAPPTETPPASPTETPASEPAKESAPAPEPAAEPAPEPEPEPEPAPEPEPEPAPDPAPAPAPEPAPPPTT